jgi:hypothetical protein
MPVRVSIELDEDVLAAVIEELKLSNPPTFTLNSRGKVNPEGNTGRFSEIRGLYDPATNHVTVAAARPEHSREGLYVLTKHLRHTVLHELRHAWQREHWTAEQKRRAGEGEYELRIEERDANDWAAYASPKYRGLVRVSRTQVGKSGFSQLSNHTRRQTG